nr:hypothetical protein BaRGS_031110 [Batillaria attramentaria]
MWVTYLAYAASLLALGTPYYFQSGFSHHYTYWAENSMFGGHNVTTILKIEEDADEWTYSAKEHDHLDNLNRSLCVNDLRNVLENLHTEDYRNLVDDILGSNCSSSDTHCEDKRLILIDVVSRMGDKTSQDLIISHVLSKSQPNFVRAIEGFCFGKSGQHHGSRSMTRVQNRACLAVGILTKHLAGKGRHRQANRLANQLETWLDEHGKGDHKISKRDTWLTDTEDEDHHVSKAILLHALGNAALARSRRHLLEHAQPNRGHHMWRRAALDAMRQYTCNETARALLDSLLHEEVHSVRQMALSVYHKHPQRHHAALQEENVMLSQNYTYPAVARAKRGIFERILFQFKLGLPTIDWKKDIGTSDVGASFGVYFENGIGALFKVLSGHVEVNVHDKLWAEAHVGLIGKKWELLFVEVCYRGKLSYNINVIKDFTVGASEDITKTFDSVSKNIIEPIQKVANKISTMFQDPVSGAKSGFNALKQAVRDLPKRTAEALRSAVNLSEIAESVSGLPLVSKLQQVAGRAQTLMEDINNEATELFASIKDAAVVALPFGEEEIRQVINTVLSKLGDITQSPNKAVSFMERAKNQFQLALQRILEGNNIMHQAVSFLSGSKSTFMNAAHELKEIIEVTRNVVDKLKADHTRRKRDANPFDDLAQTVVSACIFSNFLMMMMMMM